MYSQLASRLVLLLGIFALSSAVAEPSATQKPPLEFDTKLSVACRDVTPGQNTNSNTRIVEVKLRISANFSISENILDTIVYSLSLPPGIAIEDYLPKTELGSDAGSIVIREASTRRDGITTSMRGEVHAQYAAVGAGLDGSRQTDKANEFVSGVERSSLPQKQLIMAAGTKTRATQLYFKLRPFSQITLEGEREFACLLAVPKDWKGDCLKLECAAIVKESQATGVEQTFGIGLYLVGDNEAQERARVEELAKSMESLKFNAIAFSPQKQAASDGIPGLADPTTVKPKSSEALLGKWSLDKNSADKMEFLPNGTMTENAPNGRVFHGTYKQRSDGGL